MSSRIRARASVHVAVLAVTLAIALFAAPALALAAPTLSSPSPAQGAVVGATYQQVSIGAASTLPLTGASTVTLDGANVSCSWAYESIGGHWEWDDEYEEDVWVGDTDYTRGRLTHYPSVLRNGTHTVTATVRDSSGSAASQTWSFTAATPPIIQTPLPADGASVSSTNPLISATVVDNYGTLSSTTMLLDGASVPAYFSGSSFRYPATNLSGGPHTVIVTATDSTGPSATKIWTFFVLDGGPKFSGATPTTAAPAHVADPVVSVSVTDNVALVKPGMGKFTIDGTAVSFTWVFTKPDKTAGTVSFKPAMLADGSHAATLTVSDVAGNSKAYGWAFTVAAPPVLSSFAPPTGSSAATDRPTVSFKVADNSGAAPSATARIDGTTDVALSYDAATKTFSGVPASALANDALHSVAATVTDAAANVATATWTFRVQTLSQMPVVATCTTCHPTYPAAHPTDDCDACHAAGNYAGCLDCHSREESHDASVLLDKDCAWCHAATGPNTPSHPADLEDAHRSATGMTACLGCHSSSLTVEHYRRDDDSGVLLSCTTCHGSTDTTVTAAIAAGDSRCSACHAGADHEAFHLVDSGSCASCHAGDSLTAVHIDGYDLDCETCHESTATLVVDAIANHQRQCSACHPAPDHRSAHDVDMGSGTIPVYGRHGYHNPYTVECASCHAQNLETLHLDNCALCHETSNPTVIAAVGSGNKSCDACHGGMHGDQPAAHWNFWCESCHDVDGDNHVDCGCHSAEPSPDTAPPTGAVAINSGAAWTNSLNATLTLSASDTGGSGLAKMRFSTDNASWGAWETFATSRSWSFSAGDGSKSIYVQFQDGVGNFGASVNDTIGFDGTAPSTTCDAVSGQDYVGAHTFTLNPSDAGGSGVASTWWQLDGTLSTWTSGTSVSVPAPASGTVSHTIYWYSRDAATNAETTRSVTFTISAPPADTTPPTTTSSFNPGAGAVYKTNQPVTLTAVDNPGGSGVNATYYRIDAAAFVAGSTFTVAGDGLHTFSYYSVDNASRTEGTHVSNQFRIDTVAPVTTVNAVEGQAYTGAQNFTLTASDVNGSGVAGTWFSLDGGAPSAGTSVAVGAPPTGTASHTISWYSTDVATNQETTHLVTFTVAAPAVAQHGSQTFSFIGVPNPYPWLTSYSQTFVVPAGVTSLDADLYGGQGGGGHDYYQEQSDDYTSGGLGGQVTAAIPVTPGETLTLSVGGQGQTAWDWSPVQGGWPNGGNASAGSYYYEPGYSRNYGSGGGGGSSAILRGSTILVEAGGGGGGDIPGGSDGLPGGSAGNVLAAPYGGQTGGAGGIDQGAGGGGWNAGSGGPGATGGTSYVAVGTLTQLAPGVNSGDGRIVLSW